jgi:D-methionine transport system substrate-binding protein
MTSSAKSVDRHPISSAEAAQAMCGRRSIFGLALASALALVGLAAAPASPAAAETVRVGIVGGEDEDVWQVVADQAAKSGLTIKAVVFNDYTQPNEALERGDVDANAFQHKPYLDNQIKTRGYHIVPVGFTAVWPIGLYSHKHHAVADLPQGAIIGVPNDPSNEGRALIVLQSAGLIKLRDGAGILATTADIVSNPKDVKIKELDAGVVGRAIDDLDAAVVNTDWALKSGLKPDTDRIAQEPLADNPYRNFIAVKVGHENDPWVKTLVSAYQNDAVKDALAKVYHGTGLPAW